MVKQEVQEDLKRAVAAVESAERNLQDGDLLTAANRSFMSCENAVYVMLKLKYGSSSISRMKIALKLSEIDKEIKELYDLSYDLRVQADYGRQERVIKLTRENLEISLNQVKQLVERAKMLVNDKNNHL